MTSDDFLVEDYKLALGYVQGQFGRLWQRFNYFLTVQLGLFGFLGWLVFDKGTEKGVWQVCAIGALISVLWYIVAAQDHGLVVFYRKRTQSAAARIAASPSLKATFVAEEYVGKETDSVWNSPLSWYLRPISITRLPALISLLLLGVWAFLLSTGARSLLD
jgi:hypothetical protein